MSNNKLDILNFKGDFDRAIYLQHKLNERVFSKTEIDVVYSDFTNWERNGLLDVINNHQKGSHKKLSYVDYVWVSIVKQLRVFGFSYDEIKSVKKTLFSNMFEDKELVKEFLSKKEYISKKSGMKINDLNKLDVNEINFQSWSKNIHMQLNSVFYITQKCCEIMSKNLQGSVVNIASIYGVVGNDMSIYENTNITPPAAYSAIKGGLINFTKYLASYYGSKSIRVNCVSPGGVYDNQDKTFVKNYCKKVPLKRMAKADDISPSVSFLLSDESKYITGHNLIVDGGWTAI